MVFVFRFSACQRRECTQDRYVALRDFIIDPDEATVRVSRPGGELGVVSISRGSNASKSRTTLAVRAVTSRSDERAARVALREAMSEGDSRDTSRRHSFVKA